jgi:Secretion system C-terminal sorting domain
MKKNNKFSISLIVFIAFCNYTIGQTSLGTSKNFLDNLKNDLAKNTAKGNSSSILLKVNDIKAFEAKINFNKSEATSQLLVGEIKNTAQSTFYLKVEDNITDGHIIFKDKKIAYKYYSDKNGNAFVSEVDINTLICINYENVPQKQETISTHKPVEMKIAAALLNLESFPGAKGCLYLDFDGYNLPAGSRWNNGNPINAAPSGMSDVAVQQHWEVVSEDYRPFSVNVTTNEAVFNTYPKNRRMRIVVTPTDTASPGAGGVAFIGSFNYNDDTPCWTFITTGKSGGDASSHEAGHTFDLRHDGRTEPVETYFSGLNNTPFGPIMGASYRRPVAQWSKGEYNFANNSQDDVAVISGTKFGVGYRVDDYGNDIASSSNITYDVMGVVVKKTGIITTRTDLDFFTFTTKGGDVSLDINTVARDGDLDILVSLYNATGTLINTYTNQTAAALNATLRVNLAAGKYFISVDGTGAGDPATGGYSDYASIGSYSITGKIPPSTTLATPDNDFANFNVYPNPSNGKLNIQLATSDKVEVSLFDLRGRKIYQEKFLNSQTVFNQEINLGNFSSGLYILNVESEGKKATKEILIN